MLVKNDAHRAERARSFALRGAGITAIAVTVVYVAAFSNFFATEYRSKTADGPERFFPLPALNKDEYNARMLALAHYRAPAAASAAAEAASTATTTRRIASTTPPVLPFATATTSVSVPGRPWPVPTVYPDAGAVLPFHRVVAYYGNFYSAQMGVLGEYPPDQVLAMLASTTAEWAAADPATPVIPAIQYIAVVAQGNAGPNGKYRLRMPDDQIDKALGMASEMHGLLFLDVQVGLSTLPAELPLLEKYLALPNVELAIDPEFSMKYGNPPGTVIGTYDAADVNYAAGYLASIADAYRLPPKILVVHRFTESMVTNYRDIRPLPEVQIVMDMDGWGSQAKKKGTYNAVIGPEPVQFTGIKLFYKNDLKPPSTGMLTPEEVLALTPAPIYVQYQ